MADCEDVCAALRADSFTNDTDRIDAIRKALDPCNFKCPVENLESLILQSTLPLCKKIFSKTINYIEDTLNNKSKDGYVDEINLSLKKCQDILKIINNTLMCVNQLESKKVDHFYSVPISVASILLDVFRHCQRSVSIYGTLLKKLKEPLMSVFQQANCVQAGFIKFLTNSVTFNCTIQNELDLLLEVMDLLQNTGEVLIGLDVKTLSSFWKAYMQLSNSYGKHLKMWLDVKRPVTSLTNNAVARLENVALLVDKDKNLAVEDVTKQVLRDLKISSFLLKLIVRLCELYSDHLGECHRQLVELLISLNGFSMAYLRNYNLDDKVLDFIDRNITIASGPLISQLFQDESFVKQYYEYFVKVFTNPTDGDIRKTLIESGRKTGLIILTVTIFKKLNISETNVQNVWLCGDTLSMLRNVLNIVENADVEMNMDTILNRTDQSGDSDLYEALLINTAVHVIALATEKSFCSIEKLLISKILQTHIFTALFASDLFCILFRFGTTDLRNNQLQYLMGLISKWPPQDRHRPEWVFLTRLTDRLMKMISVAEVQGVITQFPQFVTWEHFMERKGVLCDLGAVCSALDKFLSLRRSSSGDGVTRYNELMQQLRCMSCIDTSSVTEESVSGLLERLANLYRCCYFIINKNVLTESLENFLQLLVESSTAILPLMDTNTLFELLRTLNAVLPKCTLVIKLSVLTFLKKLASKYIKSNGKQLEVFKLVAQLFGFLIKDSDVFVSVSALDSFKSFAAITRHADVISFTAQIDREVEKAAKDYLQGNFQNDDVLEFNKYLNVLGQCTFKHKCVEVVNVESSVGVAMDSKVGTKIGADVMSSSIETDLDVNRSVNDKINLALKELNCTVNKAIVSNSNGVTGGLRRLNILLNELENCVVRCKTLDALSRIENEK